MSTYENYGAEVSFSLDPDTARSLVSACDEYRMTLEHLSIAAGKLSWVGGFGTLASGRALQVKFEEKAVGGPDALVDVLASHIAVVEAMQAQFQASVDNAFDQESLNVSTLKSIDQPN
ncbi:hypothetical protein QM716_27040 [Rhodococcus sp. IEGM 1409]|uniref:hypothetical protein n=1 Tax=Rhodococcus sp. IEGM 1409 TaxID=3047082 RepID=UPI0024B6FB65|nr:hypothetical protein [Rhodococcus sp. IEGM 1409]MDI9903524.1 hypothetical protein [Rhodococcus sp. IEGM 1409]